MNGELCRLCGGDGRIGNALGGSSATCPGCHGSGRRVETSYGFHDVTKTKPSHHRSSVATSTGPKGPTTSEGVQLALEVNASAVLGEDAKTRLLAEIVNHESTLRRCAADIVDRGTPLFSPPLVRVGCQGAHAARRDGHDIVLSRYGGLNEETPALRHRRSRALPRLD